MEVIQDKSWKERLKIEFEKSYFVELLDFINEEKKSYVVYPPLNLVFNAFEKCSYEDVKVVLLGQDPYHGSQQANGLSFSVNNGIRKPPSLKNIFKELEADCGLEISENGNLESWAKQGVLLLNATLTVRANTPGSHQNKGWEIFTDEVIRILSLEKKNLVFILWGAYAQKKGSIIDAKKHLILKAAHPSPFSAYNGFFGCKHFSQCNEYLIQHGKTEVNWKIEDSILKLDL